MDKPPLTGSIKLPTTATGWMRWVLGAIIVGLIGYGYFVQPVDLHFTCATWLYNQWTWPGTNYSHGPLVPLIALGLMAMKHREIRAVRFSPVMSAAWIIVVAMAFYYLGVKGMQPRIQVGALVLLLWGLTLTLGGRQLFGELVFPIGFLVLMIPLNFLDGVLGFPLQILMAKISTGVLNGMGMEAQRVGSGIRTPVFNFDVASPCSGIRSLMALMTVTAAFGYLTQRRLWKRVVLFLAAIPLAVMGNVCRVLGIALVGQIYGAKLAMEVHDTVAGFIVYGVALACMVAFGLLLNVPLRPIIDKWLQPLQPATANQEAPTAQQRKENHE